MWFAAIYWTTEMVYSKGPLASVYNGLKNTPSQIKIFPTGYVNSIFPVGYIILLYPVGVII